MGKGGWNAPNLTGLPEYSWDEIRKHKKRDDRWLVIDGFVYDVTKWAFKHPGGEKIISGFCGSDGTEAWNAFHIDKARVNKYMKPLLIGRLEQNETELRNNSRRIAITEDFRKLRSQVEVMGLFQPSVVFFVAVIAHILFFDFLGWWTLKTFGVSWLSYIVAGLFLATAQMQAGWAQHDYGHLSVFKSSRLNHWAHILVINFFKGASSHWWNYRHFNHHAKPNVLRMDPDIKLDPLFLVGDVVPKEYGKKKKKYLPYASQHKYFYFVLPPLLLPLYFNLEIPYFLIKRKELAELFWTMAFFVRWQLMYYSMLGFWGVFGLFLFVRFIESHWFVWATQMSHLPMPVDYDGDLDWVSSQLRASRNVEHSWFNDWFSGHLNFQIEHHLFPTMPRHNLVKAAPLVRELCKKYNIEYQCKPMLTAFADIVGSLKSSGQVWLNAYNM